MQFDDARGYGFIAPDFDGDDVFVHANDLIGEKYHYRPGSRVEFQLENNERGPKASEVRLLKNAVRAPIAGADDELSDVLTVTEYQNELTEALLVVEPVLTSAQILQARRRLLSLAEDHGWVTA